MGKGTQWHRARRQKAAALAITIERRTVPDRGPTKAALRAMAEAAAKEFAARRQKGTK